MDDLIMQFTVILVLVGINAGTHPSCPNTWTLYEKENVCIKAHTTFMNWYGSRTFCQRYGGDLVQIWSKEKEAFIKGIRPQPEYGSWVGAIYRRNDNTFEYINGTTMPTSGPDGWTVEDANVTGLSCLYMEPTDAGLAMDACTFRRMYVCETSLNPTIPSLQDSSACTLKSCFCKKEDWLYMKHRNKYITINKAARNFSISALICENLGGQLLIVPDVQTQTFVKNISQWWVPRSTFYWMGLSKINNHWKWIDGKELLDNSYHNKFYDALSIEECVAVMWGNDAIWTATSCSSEQYHICEATVPCDTQPIISVNNRRQTDKANVTMINDQRADVKCSFSGHHQGTISTIRVGCGSDQGNRGVMSQSMIRTFRIDIRMHRKSCYCQLLYNNGTTKRIEFTIYFKTRPRFVDEEANNKTFKVKIGAKLILEFEIYANPKPTTYALTKNGSMVHHQDYEVFVFPLKNKELYYTIGLDMHTIDRKKMGEYILQVENGIEKRLEYTFTIKAPIYFRNPKRFLAFIIGFAFSIFWTFIFMGFIWRKEGFFHVKQRHNTRLYRYVRGMKSVFNIPSRKERETAHNSHSRGDTSEEVSTEKSLRGSLMTRRSRSPSPKARKSYITVIQRQSEYLRTVPGINSPKLTPDRSARQTADLGRKTREVNDRPTLRQPYYSSFKKRFDSDVDIRAGQKSVHFGDQSPMSSLRGTMQEYDTQRLDDMDTEV